MAIVALHHVQLAMPAGGERAAHAFYAGVLGFDPVDKPANLAKRGGCWFAAGAARLHLGIDAAFRPAQKAHPAFIVEDLDDQIQRLAQAGSPVDTDEPLPGFDRCYTADPFGNRIELMQPLEGS